MSPKTSAMDPGSESNPGNYSPHSPSLDPTPLLGAQIALQGAHTIGQSLDMLERAASSQDGGICSCKEAKSRQAVGQRGVWKNTSWVPVIFTPYLASLRMLPGRAWQLSGWSTGYLQCLNCGGRSAVVSLELSGCAVTTTLHVTLPSTLPKPKKRAR